MGWSLVLDPGFALGARCGELVFANPSTRVSEIFRITGRDDAFAVDDSIGAAADHFP